MAKNIIQMKLQQTQFILQNAQTGSGHWCSFPRGKVAWVQS